MVIYRTYFNFNFDEFGFVELLVQVAGLIDQIDRCPVLELHGLLASGHDATNLADSSTPI